MDRLRISAMAIAFSIVISAGGVPADAAPKWCEDDPIIVVGSHELGWKWSQVITRFEAAYAGSLQGPLDYRIYVPAEWRPYTHVYLPPSPVAKVVTVETLPPGYWPSWSDDGKVKIEVQLMVPATSTFVTYSEVSGSIRKSFRVRGASNVMTTFHISMH